MKQVIILSETELGDNLMELISFQGFEVILFSGVKDLWQRPRLDKPCLLILDEGFLYQAEFKTFIDRCLSNIPCILMTYDKPNIEDLPLGLFILDMPFSAGELYGLVNKSIYSCSDSVA